MNFCPENKLNFNSTEFAGHVCIKMIEFDKMLIILSLHAIFSAVNFGLLELVYKFIQINYNFSLNSIIIMLFNFANAYIFKRQNKSKN